MTDRLAHASAVDSQPDAPPLPAAPRTLDETGLGQELITQLVAKTLYTVGELTGVEVAKRLGVLFPVIETALDFLKDQRYCEIAGGALVGGASFRYRLTQEGRKVAALYLQQDQYVGRAPVPLPQYRAYMAALRSTGALKVTREDVYDAFSHLVLSETVLDEIGPAVNGGHSIFIYGPPGNGKTVIARTIRSLLGGDVAIPHAIEVEGSIIRVFDPTSHEDLPVTAEQGLSVDVTLDRRWALCRRPVVMVGGELTLEALELTFDARLGYYRAPLQLVANGGLLIVDDFGRQRCSPHDLLNRWMVPLESGVDYLTLRSGLKFEVPFQVFLAFATNIKPSELVDEAFLRRVQYKVFAENPTTENFIRIFEQCCRERDLPFERGLVEQLLDGFYYSRAMTPRACHPRDLINQALLLAHYRGEPRRLTADLLRSACASYFVEDQQ
jgi:predicted ATPase with chaperone activity